jgi:hypothetical protein
MILKLFFTAIVILVISTFFLSKTTEIGITNEYWIGFWIILVLLSAISVVVFGIWLIWLYL